VSFFAVNSGKNPNPGAQGGGFSCWIREIDILQTEFFPEPGKKRGRIYLIIL
jgi:hypothetical protein